MESSSSSRTVHVEFVVYEGTSRLVFLPALRFHPINYRSARSLYSFIRQPADGQWVCESSVFQVFCSRDPK